MSGRGYEWYTQYLQILQDNADDKEKAAKEPMWRNAGKTEGLQIWRIQNLHVTSWPKKDYGKFYDGDSYIILKTSKSQSGLKYDLHTWIGKYSTEDEFTTASYKTMELATYLDDKPIQHREAQERESSRFKSYFDDITYLHGGAPSGLKGKEKEENKPRLYHFHGERLRATVREVPMDASKIDDTDVYILEAGPRIYQWNGKGCNNGEKASAMRYIQKLMEENLGRTMKKEVFDQDPSGTREDDEFFQLLAQYSGVVEETSQEGQMEDSNFDFSSDVEYLSPTNDIKELYRLSDAEGEMKFTKMKEGEIRMSDFDGQDVFIFDTKKSLFVWIGNSTTTAERKNASIFANNYLLKTDHPLIPITCLKEGRETNDFLAALS